MRQVCGLQLREDAPAPAGGACVSRCSYLSPMWLLIEALSVVVHTAVLPRPNAHSALTHTVHLPSGHC